MSNLKKGSTVGGFGIVSELDKDQHVHHVSEIDGLGGGASVDTGPGSGFDADTLNSLHYTDIASNFVNRDGDTIVGGVSLTDVQTSDFSATSRNHALTYMNNEVIIDAPSVPLVSISPTCNLTYDTTNQVVDFSGGDILIGGTRYHFNTLSLSLAPVASTTFYIYAYLNSGTLELVTEEGFIEHSFRRIHLGTISFDSNSQLDTVNQRALLCNLDGISLREDAAPYSAVLSDPSGNVDPSWFNFTTSASADTINLQGNTTVTSGTTNTYTITDYDSYSVYFTNTDQGTTSLDGDQITFNAPVVTEPTNVLLTVNRNISSIQFVIEVLP